MCSFETVSVGKSALGGRRYLEDITDGKYEEEYYYLAVYDGHNGIAAAEYAYQHLWNNINFTAKFKSDRPYQTIAGIRDGFAHTQVGLSESFKARNGDINQSGTTVACAILQGQLAYFANVGDSGIVLGKLDKGNITAEVVSRNHRPDNVEEILRIGKLGGLIKSNRVTHKEIHPSDDDKSMPRLNLTRSLGDVWSYLKEEKDYLISPVPHVCLYHINPDIHKFILLASDGLLDVFDATDCVKFIYDLAGDDNRMAKEDAMAIASKLIQKGIDKWNEKGLSADNISVVLCFFLNSSMRHTRSTYKLN